MRTRLYLRASTVEQDASRAQEQLEAFAAEHKLDVVGIYAENESGAKLERPELFRLLKDSKPGDVLLTEQIDRVSRLNEADWNRLKAEIKLKRVSLVSLDLPTSWVMTKINDEFTSRIMGSLNELILDVLAAAARKDYTDRRRRQAQGLAKAKSEGRLTGRSEDKTRNDAIAAMLNKTMSWTQIQAATGCSRAHIAKIAKRGTRIAV